MKVLRVVASMDPAQGGLSQAIRSSVAALDNLGVSTEVVSCDNPEAPWLGKDSFPVHTLGPGKFGYGYTPNLEPWLRENLSRFDAVIIDGLWQWPSICATRALAWHRRAVTSDGCRVTSFQTSDKDSDSLPVTPNPRLFVMPHGMLDPWFQRDKSRRVKAVRNWFYWWLVERRVVNSADALLFTCQQELELARTTFGGYQPKKEVVVGLGIEEPPASEPKMQEVFAARCPDLRGRPYLLFMSRVHPKKGVDLLVRAYARVRSEFLRGLKDLEFLDLVVAGPGWESDYGREVRGLIDEANRSIALTEHRSLSRGLGRQPLGNTEHFVPIHAVDMLQGDAKWGALYGCEAFVLPSHQENFGIAVVEALACGKPVLISDQVNIWREIVEDGGGLMEEDTEEGVEKLLRQFFERPVTSDGLRVAGGSAFAQSDSGVTRSGPRECYLKRFAIGPAVRRLADSIRD